MIADIVLAHHIVDEIRESANAGIPLVAVDVPPATFSAMTSNQDWISQDDAWRNVTAAFPSFQNSYALQIREALLKRVTQGHRLLLLVSLRDDSVFLFRLKSMNISA